MQQELQTMNVYTAQEWQNKFKIQAGKNKQLLHDLNCTGLISVEDYQKLEADRDGADNLAHTLQEERNKLEAAYNESAQTANTYCLKILEANKILNEIESDPNLLSKCWTQNFKKLRKQLSLNPKEAKNL
jgi:hypothetical protein